MRVNLPVVAREYPFPAGETLVSTTDLQGRILYCNPMFVEVSGYAKEELLGQPHNIVRHPDMPEEAYRDMWETIGKGIPWSAPVKNRRKDGTYYWVMANVTPLMEGDQPVGYMSVRTEASRDQIQQAEQLYKTMQAEKQAGVLVHGLRAGRVIKNNLWGRVSGALRMGVFSKMLLGMGVVVAAAMAAAQLGGQGLTLASGLAWLGVVVLAVCYCVYMHSVLVSPLQQMLKWANRMAAGDLTQKITVSRRHGGAPAKGAVATECEFAVHRARCASGGGAHAGLYPGDRPGQPGPVSPHRVSGQQPGANGCLDGRNHRYGAPDCRVCPPGYFAGHAGHYGS